jgi:hypothetical protein
MAAVVVLAKHPVAGHVKTRLAATIGAAEACRLYEGFVRDLALRLRRGRLAAWWAFTPASAPFERLVGTRRCFAQRGSDLGRRIDHALSVVHRRTGRAVIVLGADMPHVSLREINRARTALARGADAVLGPATDGGYYLIGLRAPRRELFRGVAWGTPDVASATRRRCRELGMCLTELRVDFDVDEMRDIEALTRRVRRRPQEFPHTRMVLRDLRRQGAALRPAAFPSSGCVPR